MMKSSSFAGQTPFSGRPIAGLSRRQFLRGLGVCLALPAFESLRPASALAETAAASRLATTASGAPLRTAFVFFPNGAIPAAWWPSQPGKDFKFSATLEPLESCRQHLQVLGGLDHRNAMAGNDGAGDHARGNAVFLTGVRPKKSATDIHAGVSIDQELARRIGRLTRLPSLELTCDSSRHSGACDSGYACAYQYNLSWSSPTTPMTPEDNPRQVFERLFGAGSEEERSKNLLRRQQRECSILDFVMDDAHSMQRRLAARDRDKLDQYLTGIRDIETRIQTAEKFGAPRNPGIKAPPGIPGEYSEYVQIMYDLMVAAFQTDSTRVGTFLLAHDGDNRSFREIGISDGHHDLSHHDNHPDRIEKVAEIDRWYVQQFARFLKKLDSIKDSDGQSILHNSMIVYGGGNADGNRHTHTNLPILLAGGGGGTFQTDRFIQFGSRPTTNLFLSLADRLGLQSLERFGDSTGRLSEI